VSSDNLVVRHGILIVFEALRFRLTTEDPPASTPGPVSFEDIQMSYMPLVDEKNDRALIDILPDFLTDEIDFPGGQLRRLYTRVRDSMMTKVVVED
jgi:hypothetical protein